MRARRPSTGLPIGSALIATVLLVVTGGAPAHSAPARTAPTLFIDLSLSAGRLSWFQATGPSNNRTGTLWQRTVTAKRGSRTKTTLGTARKVVSAVPLAGTDPFLYSRAVVSASAGRVLLPPLSTSEVNRPAYRMLDRGVLTKTASITRWDGFGVRQSGPYAVVGRRIYRADGTLALDLDAEGYPRLDVFGPKVVYSTDNGTVRLRDLSQPTSTSNPLTLATTSGCRSACNLEVAIWGDTAAWARPDGTVAVRTLTTGTTRLVKAGSLIGLRLSEGVLSWHNSWHDDSITLLNLNSPTSRPQSLTLRAAEVDDHLVAGLDYDTGKLVVRQLPFGLRTNYPPRLLGVLAQAGFSPNDFGTGETWSPQIDVSKPVKSVRLEIFRAGTLVRTLTGTAPDGSIRNLSWDGDDEDGTPQPSGDYTWTLSATAIDGQGALIAADGHTPISGKVTISR